VALRPAEGQGLLIDCWPHFNCPQSEVNNHPTSLGVICDQHIEFPSHCLLVRLGVPLHISSENPFASEVRTSAGYLRSSKQYALNPRDRYTTLFMVFENRILRSIFGRKRDEDEEWRRLHNEELHSLYRSPNIVREIKSRRLRWAGYVVRMEESRSFFQNFNR
jgi:hypothetical protein